MLIVLRKRVVITAVVLLICAVGAAGSFNGRGVAIFSKSEGKIIVLDAGHGEPDGGAVGNAGSVESTLNLAVAKRLKKQLEGEGFAVIMTRETKNGIYTERSETIREKKKEDMANRLEIINSSGGDLFISIHMNLFRSEKYRGAEVLYCDKFENSLLLAELIQARIAAIDPDNQTRTVKKTSDIFLLSNAEIPAVLVECGFLSNIEEERLLNDKDYQEKLAAAICGGVKEYYISIQGRAREL